jgi:uncharacterized protein (TIGR02270 family)
MEFLRDILEEHLEEADFLYAQRRNALADDDYDLADLAGLEERLLAHVDGLVIAGGEAWDMLEGMLTGGDEGEAFTAALVALASGDSQRRSALLKDFAQADDETLDGLKAAFCLSGLGDLAESLRDLVAEAETPVAAAVLEILAFHRRGLSPEELGGVLGSDESRIRIAGLRAAAAMGWRDGNDRVREFLDEEDSDLLCESVRTGFIFNDESGLEKCRTLLAAGREPGADLQIWLGLAGNAADVGLLVAGLESEELSRGAVIALGWMGRIEAIEALLGRLDSEEGPDLSRQIGAAVCRIVGLDLMAMGLTRPEEEPAEMENEESESEAEQPDDEFDDPPVDPDEALPWPDADSLTAWWQANRANFKAGQRYRYGRKVDRDAILEVMRSGGLAERHLAACELARMSADDGLQETRALAWSQSRRLARIPGR